MLIATPGIRGIGRPTGAWCNPDGTLLAVGSSFPRLTAPPARASYAGQRLLHRLALFRRGETTPLAVLDDLEHPITAVAFHPNEALIAVGAGAYDGGFLFEGDLALWNWSDGTLRRPLRRVPEVAAVRFENGGSQLEILVRPWDESGDSLSEGDDPFRAAHRVIVATAGASLRELGDLDPSSLVGVVPAGALTSADVDAGSAAAARELATWSGTSDLGSGPIDVSVFI